MHYLAWSELNYLIEVHAKCNQPHSMMYVCGFFSLDGSGVFQDDNELINKARALLTSGVASITIMLSLHHP